MNATPIYPAKRPSATIAAAVISNTVYFDAMLALQDKKLVNGVTQWTFSRRKLERAATTLEGPGRMAIDNMLKVFAAKGNPAKLDREVVTSAIDYETRRALLDVAKKDGKITGREKDKIPAYIRDEFEYVTTGRLPS